MNTIQVSPVQGVKRVAVFQRLDWNDAGSNMVALFKIVCVDDNGAPLVQFASKVYRLQATTQKFRNAQGDRVVPDENGLPEGTMTEYEFFTKIKPDSNLSIAENIINIIKPFLLEDDAKGLI